jgi:CubicO group peptidase (beta-lactamase class C family)
VRPRHLILLTLVLLTAGVLVAVRVWAAPMARPGMGFAAKVVCSEVFVGGMTDQQARLPLPDVTLARLIRVRVDRDTRRVRASIPVVGSREAHYRPGLGCTLAHDEHQAVLPDSLPIHRPPPDLEQLWPRGDAVDPWLPDHVDREVLETVLRDAFEEPVPGQQLLTRAVVVVHEGRIMAERYAPGYSPVYRFAGWSMAKSVTGALAGILHGDGRLDLAMAELRPEWRQADDPRRGITVEHLLRMTSGLDFEESYEPTGEATRMLFDAPDAAAFAARTPLAHAPGTAWYYASGSTNLLSWTLGRAVPGDHLEYLMFPARALFHRIGMKSAVLEPDPAGTLVGSSFMYATARDWARLGLLYLHDGVWDGERVLPEGWVAYSVTPVPAARRGAYGAQWWLNAGAPGDPADRMFPELPADAFWAAGFQGQRLVVVPSADLVVVRLGVTEPESAFRMAEFLQPIIEAVSP